MSMSKWAENECQKICKQINPNFEFGKEQFDYSCSCYESALKAYKSLCEDGHSGYSFGFTKEILIRLMEGKPLSPITEEDFPSEPTSINYPDGHVSFQCSRMYSLFKDVYPDGTIKYNDIDRDYCIDIENPSNTFYTWTPINDLFPITLPYTPQKEKYKVYIQSFLTDEENGDIDTQGYLYAITPNGERIELNLFKAEIGGKWIEIPAEEYKRRLERRLDKIELKVAKELLWTLLENSSSDDICDKRKKAFKKLSKDIKDEIESKLQELCKCFINPEYWEYNTFDIHQNLCRYSEKGEYPMEIEDIRVYLHEILNSLKLDN